MNKNNQSMFSSNISVSSSEGNSSLTASDLTSNDGDSIRTKSSASSSGFDEDQNPNMYTSYSSIKSISSVSALSISSSATQYTSSINYLPSNGFIPDKVSNTN
jgi:hypothetical protein